MLKTSNNGKNLIKRFEGCRLSAYKCPAGVWTIGYGHTVGVNANDKISQTEADVLLENDLKKFEDAINKLVKVKLNQNQFDALVSFVFNIGYGSSGFGNSTMLKLLNSGKYKEAAEQFLRWVYVNREISQGLVNRRKAEKALFLS